MSPLRRRAVADAGELGGLLAPCVAEIEPGLRLLQRGTTAGEIGVDFLCVDGSGRLVLVVCDVVAGSETMLRVLEAVAWWREHTPLLERMFPGAGLDPRGAPRGLIVATRFGDRALRLFRLLGEVAPDAVECYVFEGGQSPVVAFDRLAMTPATHPAPGAAATAEAQRAAALVERLERLRFREVFR